MKTLRRRRCSFVYDSKKSGEYTGHWKSVIIGEIVNKEQDLWPSHDNLVKAVGISYGLIRKVSSKAMNARKYYCCEHFPNF